MDPAAETTRSFAWWGAREVADGAGFEWRIGPLTLEVRRSEREWRVAYRRIDAAEEVFETWSDAGPAMPVDSALEAGFNLERFAFRQTAPLLALAPALADRPVVTRPVSPFRLPPGEECRIYVSSPLWCDIRVGPGPSRLTEIPIVRASDTWFGPSTREGQLCYAARTEARLDLADVPWRPHRAVTPLVLRNGSDSALLFERLSLPVPYLTLFDDGKGGLWTEEVVMTRRKGEALSTLELDDRAPSEVGEAVRRAEPREKAEAKVLVRAWSALFG